jgi:battenin
MLSAAFDILKANFNYKESDNTLEKDPDYNHTKRQCNTMSTGTILLADIVPSMVIKLVVSFLPLCIKWRMAITVLLSFGSYLLVASKLTPGLVIFGVVLQSFSCGLGEASLLAYSSLYEDVHIITSWSSGTGAAGLIGSVSYAGLTSIGLSPSQTIYIMLIVPTLMILSFFFVLKKPKAKSTESRHRTMTSDEKQGLTYFVKILLNIFPKYMLPLGLVYYFEYTINHGLFELLETHSLLSKAELYRWYNFMYQFGVFISRSSMVLIKFNCLWLMAVLQGINLVFMIFESIYSFSGQALVHLIVIFWEGLIAGGAYVNTFRRIADEVPKKQSEFSMSITAFNDAASISLAGLTAIPIHNTICLLPPL